MSVDGYNCITDEINVLFSTHFEPTYGLYNKPYLLVYNRTNITSRPPSLESYYYSGFNYAMVPFAILSSREAAPELLPKWPRLN